MATVKDSSGVATSAPHTREAAPSNKDEAKKAVNKAERQPYLSENQLTRAASEYMVALRPQPTVDEMKTVLAEISTKDADGTLKHKCKSTDEVPPLVDADLAA